MFAMRSPSATSSTGIVLGVDMARCLLSGDASESGADRHADTGEIALAEDVAGHDFAGGENVVRRLVVVHDDLGALVDSDAEVGEGNARPQRIGEKRWRVEGSRPVGLGR